jgi:hypothetical protein
VICSKVLDIMIEYEHFPNLVGAIVKRAFRFQDNKGYDNLVVEFMDGKKLEILEEGQCGYFSSKVVDEAKS